MQSGGIGVNKEKLADAETVIDCSSLLNEKYLLVQRGKKNYYLLIANKKNAENACKVRFYSYLCIALDKAPDCLMV